jgi:hypothetical protein
VLRPEEECDGAEVAAAVLRWRELGGPCCLLRPSASSGQEGAAAPAAAADTYEAMFEIMEVSDVPGWLFGFLHHTHC